MRRPRWGGDSGVFGAIVVAVVVKSMRGSTYAGFGGLWRLELHKGAMPYRADGIEEKGYYIFRLRGVNQ